MVRMIKILILSTQSIQSRISGLSQWWTVFGCCIPCPLNGRRQFFFALAIFSATAKGHTTTLGNGAALRLRWTCSRQAKVLSSLGKLASCTVESGQVGRIKLENMQNYTTYYLNQSTENWEARVHIHWRPIRLISIPVAGNYAHSAKSSVVVVSRRWNRGKGSNDRDPVETILCISASLFCWASAETGPACTQVRIYGLRSTNRSSCPSQGWLLDWRPLSASAAPDLPAIKVDKQCVKNGILKKVIRSVVKS